ncbi:MAG TPA: ABC transporter permease [Chryseolinea sp.]
MLRNFLTVAIRNLSNNLFYSLTSITGLALGLACVFLIMQYLKQELSYDRFHEHADNIYRVTWEDENPQTRTPHPMAQALVADFPEVRSAVSISPMWGLGLTRRSFSFRNPENDTRFEESNVMAVDSTFFDVFTFPLVKGDPKTVLKNPDGILISRSMSKKYFGDEEPLGKHLAVNDEEDLIEVVGVFEDVPSASHFHFDFLVSYEREKGSEDPENEFYTWKDFGHYNYLLLEDGADATALEAKLNGWVRKYIDVPDEVFQSLTNNNFGFRLQPITKIHLHSHLRWELEANGYIAYTYMLITAALLILVIACVNFINLTTAQSAGRAKEIGIRKSLGAFRSELAIQFTGESVLVSLLAMILAVVFVEVALPFFTLSAGKPIKIDYMFFILALVGMGLITGVTAGIFPSFYLTRIKPSEGLKGKFLQGSKGAVLREGFTLFQFFASMILITCSIIIYSQLNYIQHKDLGFAQEEVIVLPIKNVDLINEKFYEIQSELLRIPNVKSASAASNVPGRPFNQNPVFATQIPQMRMASSEALIDYEFFNVLDIKFSEGRGFSRNNSADKDAFILNETAAKNLFGGQAVGKELTWESEGGNFQGSVIGVVKDFHFQSLHEPVRPLMFRLLPRYNYVLVKLDTRDFARTLTTIEQTWKKFDNTFTFDFTFLSDYLNQQYLFEQSMAKILGTFSAIAIAIACFGLLGVAALSFRQKTKEVSIRKVLGATIPEIMFHLAKKFSRMVLISVVLAVPLIWWIMDSWLENFTFRTTINPLIFAFSGVFLLVIAWVTLSHQLWKISTVNPAETLKNQ